MKYKVCILAAGAGTRMGESSNHINKAVLPVNGKAVISHIIEKFPNEVEIVIAVGHKKETVIDYLMLAYPERKFTFVEVDKIVGPGDGSRGIRFCSASLIFMTPLFSWRSTRLSLRKYPHQTITGLVSLQ